MSGRPTSLCYIKNRAAIVKGQNPGRSSQGDRVMLWLTVFLLEYKKRMYTHTLT